MSSFRAVTQSGIGEGQVCVLLVNMELGSCDKIQTGITSHSVLYFNEAGLQMFWADAKKARRIKTNMWKHNIKFHQLPYREMEHLRQVRARGRYPEFHGEVIKVNQDLKVLFWFGFLSCSPLISLLPSAVRSKYSSKGEHQVICQNFFF